VQFAFLTLAAQRLQVLPCEPLKRVVGAVASRLGVAEDLRENDAVVADGTRGERTAKPGAVLADLRQPSGNLRVQHVAGKPRPECFHNFGSPDFEVVEGERAQLTGGASLRLTCNQLSDDLGDGLTPTLRAKDTKPGLHNVDEIEVEFGL